MLSHVESNPRPAEPRPLRKRLSAAQREERMPLIQMQDVVKIFRTPAGDFPALRGIDVNFYEGEFVSVVGKSGSGKSTLINMLTGIDHPTSGSVIIADTPIHTLNESKMSRWRGRNLGIVFQFYQLLPTLTLLENVLLPMDIANIYAPAQREARARALLDMVGLADHAHKMPGAVSGGQQQSAAIARALANDPPIIAADEPTGNLDTRTAERIYGLFEELVAQGKTIVMVTHDPTLAERTNRTLLLADGEVINATIAEVLKSLDHQQMLEATRQAQTCRFAPGETIIREGEANDTLYLIAAGDVEITLEARGRQRTVARLGPGQYFGEIGLLQPGGAIANVRAALSTPVETIALGREALGQLLEQAQTLREEITHVAEARKAENYSLRQTLTRVQEGQYV
ncbi:MAG: ATP-binding cassette domain-containing protein [Anaerolineae bacterium]